MSESFLDGRVTVHAGDNREVLRGIADNSIDSICTDPPYALVSIVKRFGADGAAAVKVPEGGTGAYARSSAGFMGKKWDTGETVHAVEFWQECLRVLKPGGHLVSCSGTRTYHRMAVAIEDAGFEIRDMISWVYGSGFPKSHDVSKGIDRAAGATRAVVGKRTGRAATPRTDMRGGRFVGSPDRHLDLSAITAPATPDAASWDGWGTALKPALEPVCLARKPLIGTVAANVLQHGTGAINIDGCRVESEKHTGCGGKAAGGATWNETNNGLGKDGEARPVDGRWPANIIHDGSEEVLAAFPAEAGGQSGGVFYRDGGSALNCAVDGSMPQSSPISFGDSGSAARFFYTAKADSDDRLGSKHPTVKPVDLMQWLVRLVTPKGGLVLDPFAGTGTTAEAAIREGMRCVLIEREEEYLADIRRRMALVMAGPDERARESIKAKTKNLPIDAGPLFDTIR